MWGRLLLRVLPALDYQLPIYGIRNVVRRRYTQPDRWQFRRKWFTVFGIVGIIMLLGSLVSDAFFGTNITANVVDPVCIMLGVNLATYIFGRNQDSVPPESEQPPMGEEPTQQ